MPITLASIRTLPLILCGPILRKVTAFSVSVFVALKEERWIEMCLHDQTLWEDDLVPLYTSNRQKTLPLGRHLHVATVTLKIESETESTSLFADQLYGYNLRFYSSESTEEYQSFAHKDIGLISRKDRYGNDLETKIGLEYGHLPGFCLPDPEDQQLRMLYGSCRKPHGEGKDMLAAIEDQLTVGNAYQDPSKRPHLLVLGGDQIYADDVFAPLLKEVHDTGQVLMGWRETFSTPSIFSVSLTESLYSLIRERMPVIEEAVNALIAAFDEVEPPVSQTEYGSFKETLSTYIQHAEDLVNADDFPQPETFLDQILLWLPFIDTPVNLSKARILEATQALKEKKNALPDSISALNQEGLIYLKDALTDLNSRLYELQLLADEIHSDDSWGAIRLDATTLESIIGGLSAKIHDAQTALTGIETQLANWENSSTELIKENMERALFPFFQGLSWVFDGLNQLLQHYPNPKKLTDKIIHQGKLLAIQIALNNIEKDIKNKLTEIPLTAIEINEDFYHTLQGLLAHIKPKLTQLQSKLDNIQDVFGYTVGENDGPVEPQHSQAYRISRISPPQRARELKEFASLTSDAMESHLMFLGEFYAMYLYAWSDVLWPRDEQGVFTLPNHKEAVPAYPLLGPLGDQGIRKIQEEALGFAKDLAKVRRVLANIPTLMIFDDHEITDDWNLNLDWVEKVNNSSMGPQLLRNGLVAYAVFQDWGNQPEHYKGAGKGKEILEKLTVDLTAEVLKPPPLFTKHATEGETTDEVDQNLHSLLGLGQCASKRPETHLDELLQERKQWHYVYDPWQHPDLPTSNFFRLIVLDTRTWRGFLPWGFPDPSKDWGIRFQPRYKDVLELDEISIDGKVAPAQLIHPSLLNNQLTQQLSPDHLNLVVSPAPVFGLPLIEDGIQRVASALQSPEMADNEAWQSNVQLFEKFIQTLKGGGEESPPQYDIGLLSGDVHYAFSNQIIPTDKEGNPLQGDKKIVQFCSSAFKNQSFLTRTLGNVGRQQSSWEFFKNLVNKTSDILSNPQDAWTDLGDYVSYDFWPHLKQSFEELYTENVLTDLSDVGPWWDETPSMFDPYVHYLQLKNKLVFDFSVANPIHALQSVVFDGGGTLFWNDLLGISPLPDYFSRKTHLIQFLRDLRDGAERKEEVDTFNTLATSQLSLSESEQDEATEIIAFLNDPDRWDNADTIVGYNNYGLIGYQNTDIHTTLEHNLYWYIHRKGEATPYLGVTQHYSTDYWSQVKAQVAALAQKEYKRWRPTGRIIRERLPQQDDPTKLSNQRNPEAEVILNEYYTSINRIPYWPPGTNNIAWSAAFISYLMITAGTRGAFFYSVKHIDYIRKAKRDRIAEDTSQRFWLYDIHESAPTKGDLICSWYDPRTPQDQQDSPDLHKLTYDTVDETAEGMKYTHCDVVTKIDAENHLLQMVGGNLSSTVGQKQLNLQEDGKIVISPASKVFAIIRFRTA